LAFRRIEYFLGVATRAVRDDDFGMKSFATSVLWFFAVWVTYDMAAFATGMPRQATPLVALAAALIVYRGLLVGQIARAMTPFQTATSDSRLHGAG
jgi:hypothetical protein